MLILILKYGISGKILFPVIVMQRVLLKATVAHSDDASGCHCYLGKKSVKELVKMQGESFKAAVAHSGSLLFPSTWNERGDLKKAFGSELTVRCESGVIKVLKNGNRVFKQIATEGSISVAGRRNLCACLTRDFQPAVPLSLSAHGVFCLNFAL